MTTSYYAFGGAMVAMRDGAGAPLVYLHGDQLGLASLAPSMTGTVLSQQPFGKLRAPARGRAALEQRRGHAD